MEFSYIVHTISLILISLLKCFLQYSFKNNNNNKHSSRSEDCCSGDCRVETASEVTESDSETSSCVVCLNGIRKNDKVKVMSNCRHVFHSDCIDRWIEIDHVKKTCPLCRTPLFLSGNSFLKSEQPSWAVEQLLYLFGDDLLII